MFCEKCGVELKENNIYCYNCGHKNNNIKNTKNVLKDDNIIIKLHPEFHILLVDLSIIFIRTFYLMLVVLPVIGFIYQSVYDKKPDFLPVIIAFLILFFVLAIIEVIKSTFHHKDLEYNFYKTKLEYTDSFFNKSKKELKYKHVREIEMHQTYLEKIYNVGTINIITSAGRIELNYIKNVDIEYKKVKELIKKQ